MNTAPFKEDYNRVRATVEVIYFEVNTNDFKPRLVLSASFRQETAAGEE